jgi:hypothetical protein
MLLEGIEKVKGVRKKLHMKTISEEINEENAESTGDDNSDDTDSDSSSNSSEEEHNFNKRIHYQIEIKEQDFNKNEVIGLGGDVYNFTICAYMTGCLSP